MIKFSLLILLTCVISFSSTSQTNLPGEKECRISSGIGLAGATKNSKSIGRAVWLQLGYKMSKNISIATEYENMTYQLPGFQSGLPKDFDANNVVANNFSLLLKYHVNTKLPLKLALASGWTYTIKASEYYYYEILNPPQSLRGQVSIADDYEIPLLFEMRYAIWKAIDVQARMKCNLSTGNQSTYSSGVGVSLKL